MPKFIVHLYPIVRVKIKTEIEASTYEEAVEKATSSEYTPNFHRLFDSETDELVIEDGEQQDYALVDVVGDEAFNWSRWVHLDVGKSWGDRLLPVLRELHRTAKNMIENHGPMSEYCRAMDGAHDLLQQIEDELKAQKAPPPEN